MAHSSEDVDPDRATYDNEDVHENSRSWPKPSRFTLLSPMTSSAPALDTSVEAFQEHHSTILILATSSQMLPISMTPLLYAPLSGRKNILSVSSKLLSVFIVGCGQLYLADAVPLYTASASARS